MKQTIDTSYLEKGYGQFPYILIRNYPAIYTQIPLHSEDLKSLKLEGFYVTDELLEHAKDYETACRILFLDYWLTEFKKGIAHDMCLVMNKKSALYISKKADINFCETIPYGGSLQAMDNTLILLNGDHYIYNL
jgi:hypothetical protein